jgi:hypothetical protein
MKPYVLTRHERNLTAQQLINQGFADVQLPNGQAVSLTAQPLFFNASGSHGQFPPGNIVDLATLRANNNSGNFIFVIVAAGGGAYELRVGLQTTTRGHEALADGLPVHAAGQVIFANGQITTLNNSSGHYMPTGVSPAFVEGAFQAEGFSASGLYMEI